MSDLSLVLHEGRRFSVTPAAESLKAAALEQAALVARVSSPEQNEVAVKAQASLKELISLVEKMRVAAKQPSLDEGRHIDAVAKSFVAELSTELDRIGQLCGDYQAVLERQRMAAEAAQKAELDRLDRERQAELAKAQTIEQIAEVQEKHDQIAQAVKDSKPVPEPVRATGQVVKSDWEIQVVDVHALYRQHPFCVKLEPLLGEIKQLLNEGGRVAGVKAMRVTRSDVRAPKGAVVEV